MAYSSSGAISGINTILNIVLRHVKKKLLFLLKSTQNLKIRDSGYRGTALNDLHNIKNIRFFQTYIYSDFTALKTTYTLNKPI